ncbi:hypothetical protein LXL04_035091 [Taraxacum kok-saghyz]
MPTPVDLRRCVLPSDDAYSGRPPSLRTSFSDLRNRRRRCCTAAVAVSPSSTTPLLPSVLSSSPVGIVDGTPKATALFSAASSWFYLCRKTVSHQILQI